jgi:hypothetical protein
MDLKPNWQYVQASILSLKEGRFLIAHASKERRRRLQTAAP